MSMTMASNRHNLLEEARPPEQPHEDEEDDDNRRLLNDVSSEEPTSLTGLVQNEEVPILDTLQNIAYLGRTGRFEQNANDETSRTSETSDAVKTPNVTKSHSCRESLARDKTLPKVEQKRPTSLQSSRYSTLRQRDDGSRATQGDDRSNKAMTWRRSYHKDVEEALSSLLWEPYECRQQTSTQTTDGDLNYWCMNEQNSLSSDLSSSISTSSSCNSLCDIDRNDPCRANYVRHNNNQRLNGVVGAVSYPKTMTPSFTDEFISSNRNSYGNYDQYGRAGVNRSSVYSISEHASVENYDSAFKNNLNLNNRYSFPKRSLCAAPQNRSTSYSDAGLNTCAPIKSKSNMTTSFTDDFSDILLHPKIGNSVAREPTTNLLAPCSVSVVNHPTAVTESHRCGVVGTGPGQSRAAYESRGVQHGSVCRQRRACSCCSDIVVRDVAVDGDCDPRASRDSSKCLSSIQCLRSASLSDIRTNKNSIGANVDAKMRLSVPPSTNAVVQPLVPNRVSVQSSRTGSTLTTSHVRTNADQNDQQNGNGYARNGATIQQDQYAVHVTSGNVVQSNNHPRTTSLLSQSAQGNTTPARPLSTQNQINGVDVIPLHVRNNSGLMQAPGAPALPNRIQVPSSVQSPNHARNSSVLSQNGVSVSNRLQIPQNRNSAGIVQQPTTTTMTTNNRVQVPIMVPNHNRDGSNLSQNQRTTGPIFTQNIIHTRVPSLPGNLNVVNGNNNNNNNNNNINIPKDKDNHLNNNNVNVVNCYRAVPVNVVSSVPTIQCLNSSSEPNGNNISNVQIVQTGSGIPSTRNQEQSAQINTNEDQQHHVQHQHQQTQHNIQTAAIVESVPQRTRTFTSTEAQTDDTSVGTLIAPTQPPTSASQTQNPAPDMNRDLRRRERRERRHQRRINANVHQHNNGNSAPSQWTNAGMQHVTTSAPEPVANPDRLPDILNSHMPPPYSPISLGVVGPSPAIVTNGVVPPSTVIPNPILQNGGLVPNQMVQFTTAGPPFAQVPLVQGSPQPVPVPVVPVPSPAGGLRFQFQNAVGMRRSRRNGGGGTPYSSEEQPKSCCGVLLTQPVSIRWFIVMIAFVGVCCVLVGTVLGAMKASGREHLTVSLLMIGVGIILVTVSGIAWRLTSHDAPTCRAMLGFGGSGADDDGADAGCSGAARRFVPRLPPSYGRPHHPYAAMMYPEFQYRPPPPSYQASMQEYRLRLLLLDRHHTPVLAPGGTHAVTPPPTYRSHAGSLLRAPLTNRRDASQSEYSCPPSYRSRTSSNRPVLDPNGTPANIAVDHSREHSLSLSDSNGSVVNVVNVLTNDVGDNNIEDISLDNVKVVPDAEIAPLRMLLKSASENNLDSREVTKDGNLVTIVQTGSDQSPVIVTVSGSQMATTNAVNGSSSHEVSTEMEILAHL